MKGKGSLLLTCLLLNACAVGEDYQRPILAVDDQWQALNVDGSTDATSVYAKSTVSLSTSTPSTPKASESATSSVMPEKEGEDGPNASNSDENRAETEALKETSTPTDTSAEDNASAVLTPVPNVKHHHPKKHARAVDNHGLIVIHIVPPEYLTSPIWWERFHDPALSDLLEKAKASNNDLKVAQAHIAEVRGNARSTTSILFPQVNATTSISHNGAGNGALSDTVKQAGLSATWDIDLFGGDARNIEAAEAEIEATMADRDKALLTVLSNVATNYVQLRSLQQQRALTLQNLRAQQDTLKVTLGQRHEGAVSDLEVARAKAEVSGTAARLPQINTAMVASLNRISVLTGEQPHMLDHALVETQPIPEVPPEIVVSTPIDVVERRPDIQASERRLAEATALSGAAFAELFPKITLEGFFGGQWSKLYGFSAPLNATASALTPLLEWGRIHGLIDATNARQEEAFYTYRQTVLLALEEIENALTSYLNEQKRQEMLTATVREQRKATEVATEQYKVGAATQLDLLTAENSQLQAESDLTVSKATLATDLIQLYTAMGEDWAPELQPEPEPQASNGGFFHWLGF